jgi:hypothetical protein
VLADCEGNIKYNKEVPTAEARLFGAYLLNWLRIHCEYGGKTPLFLWWDGKHYYTQVELLCKGENSTTIYLLHCCSIA